MRRVLHDPYYPCYPYYYHIYSGIFRHTNRALDRPALRLDGEAQNETLRGWGLGLGWIFGGGIVCLGTAAHSISCCQMCWQDSHSPWAQAHKILCPDSPSQKPFPNPFPNSIPNPFPSSGV